MTRDGDAVTSNEYRTNILNDVIIPAPTSSWSFFSSSRCNTSGATNDVCTQEGMLDRTLNATQDLELWVLLTFKLSIKVDWHGHE